MPTSIQKGSNETRSQPRASLGYASQPQVTNRHPVDELADLQRRKCQIENRIEDLREEHEIINTTLSVFVGRCGHRWVGSTTGSYACPLCNDHDGDHHLVSMEAMAVQPEDWGMAWERLGNLGQRRWDLASIQGFEND